jgi:hypothetical protein
MCYDGMTSEVKTCTTRLHDEENTMYCHSTDSSQFFSGYTAQTTYCHHTVNLILMTERPTKKITHH